MHPDEIRYALSKQVPDIAHWATFSTNSGELRLTGADARRIAALPEFFDRARAAFDKAISLANTAAEAAHIRQHLDKLMNEGKKRKAN